MEQPDRLRDGDSGRGACPHCGGRGYYELVPVGLVTCPECWSKEAPSRMSGRDRDG